MFEGFRFGYYAEKMATYSRAEIDARKAGKDEVATKLLRKALKAGMKALAIESPKIPEELRATIANTVKAGRKLYMRDCLLQMPADERDLVLELAVFWSNLGLVMSSKDMVERMVSMFDIAKDRLGDSLDVLHIIYDGDHTPPTLRRLIARFASGELSREEIVAQLDKCSGIVRKWVPKLFAKFKLAA